MKYLHPVAAVPNVLIKDNQVHHSTKKVAVALLLMAGRKNRAVRVTFRDLAQLAHCSVGTAQQAIRELIDGGYILKTKCYHYGEAQGHLIYAANAYHWMRREGGYTLVRRDILNYDITPAAFANLLYLYNCAGQKGRAFPSLRRIAGLVGDVAQYGLAMSKSTVCRTMAALRRLQAVVRLHCRTIRGCFASNSYFPTDLVISNARQNDHTEAQEFFDDEGSPIFDKPIFINQITKDYTFREKNSGVAEFGTLHKYGAFALSECRYYYDGVGVKVFVSGEHELTA